MSDGASFEILDFPSYNAGVIRRVTKVPYIIFIELHSAVGGCKTDPSSEEPTPAVRRCIFQSSS